MQLIAQRVERTGKQSLWRNNNGEYFVSIKNRTYESTQPIPVEKAEIWNTLLGGADFSVTIKRGCHLTEGETE